MPHYYTEFSFAISNIMTGEREWLERHFNDWEESDTHTPPDHAFSAGSDGDTLWIHEDEGCDLEGLAQLLQKFLAGFRPEDSIGFSWADTCSIPRLDSFGGGAVFITAKNIEWVNVWDWLNACSIA